MKITKDLLKQMIAEEMANLGSVNEEDTDPDCAEIKKTYNKMSYKADEAFRDDWATQSGIAYQLEAEAEAYKKKHSNCFEKEVPHAQPGKSGMDITNKQYGLGEDLDEGFTYDTMTPEEKKKGIEREERSIASDKKRLEKDLASAKNEVQRELALRIYKRNVEQSKRRIARLKGGPPIPPPERFQPPQPDRPAYPGDTHFYGDDPRQFAPPLPEGIKESKKDMLKRIVVEEVVKLELERLGLGKGK